METTLWAVIYVLSIHGQLTFTELPVDSKETCHDLVEQIRPLSIMAECVSWDEEEPVAI